MTRLPSSEESTANVQAGMAVPEGMLEHEARTAIRDLRRVYGFEAARQIVAEILNDEAERKH